LNKARGIEYKKAKTYMQREYRIGAVDFWLKNSGLYNLSKI
jgi:hypothetical protein